MNSKNSYIILILCLFASCDFSEETESWGYMIGQPMLNAHVVLKDSLNSNAPNVCEDNVSFRSSAVILPKSIPWRRYQTREYINTESQYIKVVSDQHYGVETKYVHDSDSQLIEKSVYLMKNYLPIGQWYYWTNGQLDSMHDYEEDIGITYYQACDIARENGIKLHFGDHGLEASFTLEWRDYQKYWSIIHWDNENGVESGAIVLINADNGKFSRTGDCVLITTLYCP